MFGRFLCFKDTIKNSYRQIDCHADSRLAMTECPPIWTRTLRQAQGSWAAAGLLSAVEAHCFAMQAGTDP